MPATKGAPTAGLRCCRVPHHETGRESGGPSLGEGLPWVRGCGPGAVGGVWGMETTPTNHALSHQASPVVTRQTPGEGCQHTTRDPAARPDHLPPTASATAPGVSARLERRVCHSQPHPRPCAQHRLASHAAGRIERAGYACNPIAAHAEDRGGHGSHRGGGGSGGSRSLRPGRPGPAQRRWRGGWARWWRRGVRRCCCR